MKLPLISLALLLLAPLSLFAHGDLHEQIEALSKQISKDPANPALLLRRGELYRVHQDWEKALRDFEKARELKPDLASFDFLKGRLFFEKKEFQQALACLNKAVEKEPKNPEALLARARTLTELKKFIEAETDYSRAINLAARLQPEHFIERARVALQAGNPTKAVEGLDEGLSKLGRVVTLQLEAVDILTSAGKYDEALRRLDLVIAAAPRKEKWLAQKGDILVRAGKKPEAEKNYKAALDALAALPAMHRSTKASTTLQSEITQKLTSLQKK